MLFRSSLVITFIVVRFFPAKVQDDSGTGEEDKKEDSSKEQMEKQWQCH